MHVRPPHDGILVLRVDAPWLASLLTTEAVVPQARDEQASTAVRASGPGAGMY